MLLKLTEDEMIDLWLLRKGFEPLRDDCRVSRSDAADLREIARTECAVWYSKILHEAPPNLLYPRNISKDPRLNIVSTTGGAAVLKLPPDVVRVLEVKLASWLFTATITTPDSPLARSQYAPFCQAGPINPVAVLHPDNRLELFPQLHNDHDVPDILLCIMRESDDDGSALYVFDESLLSTL